MVTTMAYDPWYCECEHMVWEGDPDDSITGIGVAAQYDGGYPIFDLGTWYFEAQHGTGDVTFYFNSQWIDPCVNGDDHHYYTYNQNPVYGSPPQWGGYECWYMYFPLENCNIGGASSIEGSNAAVFFHPSDPPPFGYIWWIDAYTQNPPGQSGNGWSYLTAHW